MIHERDTNATVTDHLGDGTKQRVGDRRYHRV